MINHNIKGTGLSVTDELRTYVEKGLAGAEKFLAGDSTAHANVELEYSHLRDGGKYRAEFTLSSGANVYRAEEWGSTLHEAIDLASGQLAKEIRRTKKRHLALVRRGGAIIKDVIRGLRDRF
ncbi:MAG: ribosome-associated translation inhibitor RaiA [Candidatus Adlerbacteria bacterium]|nr:ribosome-associated translation inhibitor RaiA [Candidatus Adlerbacteria bacterium]MDZ4226326.1 ribosome-associated translation inhibitor RaiA [Patescibacteria group bacterium]